MPVLPGQWWICWQEKTNKFCCWETCCPWFVSADMPTCWPIHFLFNLSGISVFPFQVCLLSIAQPQWQCSERVYCRSLQVGWHSRARSPIYNFQKNLSEIQSQQLTRYLAWNLLSYPVSGMKEYFSILEMVHEFDIASKL